MCWADEGTTVEGRQGDRPYPFRRGLATQAEGLALALLGSCGGESDKGVASKERWDAILRHDDYLHVVFPKPRRVATGATEREFAASEILMTISMGKDGARPKHILVYSADAYIAFTKYDPAICVTLQELLRKSMSPAEMPVKQGVGLADLAGTWEPVAYHWDGKRFDGLTDGAAPTLMVLTVKGDSYTAECGVPFVFVSKVTGTFKIVKTERRTLQVDTKYTYDFHLNAKEKVKREDSAKQLWELVDKDTLRVSFPAASEQNERPDGFTTKKGDRRIVYTFARAKK
jgi:hypothetical protein